MPESMPETSSGDWANAELKDCSTQLRALLGEAVRSPPQQRSALHGQKGSHVTWQCMARSWLCAVCSAVAGQEAEDSKTETVTKKETETETCTRLAFTSHPLRMHACLMRTLSCCCTALRPGAAQPQTLACGGILSLTQKLTMLCHKATEYNIAWLISTHPQLLFSCQISLCALNCTEIQPLNMTVQSNTCTWSLYLKWLMGWSQPMRKSQPCKRPQYLLACHPCLLLADLLLAHASSWLLSHGLVNHCDQGIQLCASHVAHLHTGAFSLHNSCWAVKSP